ncbi:MAG: acyl-CoA thioesterase [Bdellovibrio sp.]|nr:acyl-CoA thioesterase [Bdellovibrio sp.]
MFEYELLIREGHLDSYGHVNNATYLSLFEEARWEIITQRGYGYKKVHETGEGPVILEANIKFLKELKLREIIKITLELISYQGKISKLRQTMINPRGEVACELLVTVGFFDLKARKLILPTPEWSLAVGHST